MNQDKETLSWIKEFVVDPVEKKVDAIAAMVTNLAKSVGDNTVELRELKTKIFFTVKFWHGIGGLVVFIISFLLASVIRGLWGG